MPGVKPLPWALDTPRVDPKWHGALKNAWILYPLWEGAPVTTAAYNNPFEHVHREKHYSNTSYAWIDTEHGKALRFAIGEYANIEVAKLGTQPLVAVTVLYIRRPLDTTARNSSPWGIGASSTYLDAHLPWSSGTAYFYFGNTTLTWSYTKTVDIEYWAFTGGPAGTYAYLNGGQVASNATASSRSAAAGDWKLNSGAGGAGADGQEIYFMAILKEQWTEQRIMEWYADPYGLIREEPDIYPFRVPAVAGGRPPLTQGPRQAVARSSFF